MWTRARPRPALVRSTYTLGPRAPHSAVSRPRVCVRYVARIVTFTVNGSFNIRTRQGGSGRLGHECADRRYDERDCRNSMYSGDR
eukprot:6097331-Prymnesium_polylepis.1